jgi:hypothetical protein
MDRSLPDLLKQASAVLAREATRLPSSFSSGAIPTGISERTLPESRVPEGVASAAGALGHAGNPAAQLCPITGAALPLPGAGKPDLRQQAHELMASLLQLLGPTTLSGMPLGQYAAPVSGIDASKGYAGHACPVTQASVPSGGVFDRDLLRRQAHQFIETALITFNEATGEKGLPAEDQVPLLRPVAPVQSGETARVQLSVANEENTPAEVTLYCTNFATDRGYEIPSLRVTTSPRQLLIPARSTGNFEISIAIPQQAPAGNYAGLIQAMGNTYFKAVLCIEVR